MCSGCVTYSCHCHVTTSPGSSNELRKQIVTLTLLPRRVLALAALGITTSLIWADTKTVRATPLRTARTLQPGGRLAAKREDHRDLLHLLPAVESKVARAVILVSFEARDDCTPGTAGAAADGTARGLGAVGAAEVAMLPATAGAGVARVGVGALVVVGVMVQVVAKVFFLQGGLGQ